MGETALEPVVHRAAGDAHPAGQTHLVDVRTRFRQGFVRSDVHTCPIPPDHDAGCVKAELSRHDCFGGGGTTANHWRAASEDTSSR